MKIYPAHDVRPALSPALVGLPTFSERPPAGNLAECHFFDANAAAALALKAYYDAIERLPLLAAEFDDTQLDAYDFACVFIDAFTVRLSSLCWSSGLPYEADHQGLKLLWPGRNDTVQQWRESVPGFLAEIMKCLPPPDNRENSYGRGSR